MPPDMTPAEDPPETIKEPRLWRDNGWTARVVKNEDDEGWAVEMVLQGQDEPALIGPWTMGRDKKNPKPLDTNAFNTLVKTASEVIRRQDQQLHPTLHDVQCDLAAALRSVLAEFGRRVHLGSPTSSPTRSTLP